MRTLTYAEQVQARAARVDALLRINASLLQELADQQKRLAQLEDADRAIRLLADVVSAAPGAGNVDWKRPTEWTGFTISEWEWLDRNTPEKFEAALDAADRWLKGIPAREEGT
ncbi:MAG TPA: hypothetical protein VNM48_02395 [Chloroflexota bacterium]|nr:hypothetical protein [Chloroflexota bacterium]